MCKFEKKINEMADQMIETMKARIVACSQCFNQNRETYSELDSSLGSPKPDISLYNDFEPSYSARPNLNEDIYLPSLDQDSDLPISLSPDLASRISSPKGITDDVLVFTDPPTTLNDFCEFEVVEQSNTVNELDISATREVDPCDLEESWDDISKELCNEVTEHTILDFDDDFLCAEYESFSCGFDVTKGLDVGFSC